MTDPAADAALIAALFAVDPTGLGGVALRAGPGPARDAFLDLLRGCLPEASAMRRMPAAIAEGRLLGGLDIAATLRCGRPVAERGLLAETDGGVMVLAMAERLPARTAAHLCAAIDTGSVIAAREGIADTRPARLGYVALDEGIGPDESMAPALLDRFAFHLDLAAGLDIDSLPHDPSDLQAARDLLPNVTGDEAALSALCTTALALGIASLRAPLLAWRAARVAAALAGRDQISLEDAALAARLVLAPRATVLPPPDGADETQNEPQPDEADAPPNESAEDEASDADADTSSDQQMGEIVLAAARAAIPAGLLAQLQLDASRARARSAGKVGALQKSGRRGRPAGLRRAAPGPGSRLNLVETLRAAAPWQRLRQAENPSPEPRLQIRLEDFHVTRFRQRAETTTIFAVDASGSAASNRLAEAKGAVELLLADCYIRRDKVAVIAFRGTSAELLLPPTRSLVRAKRSLAGLPGGGGTPLAAGIDAAESLAAAIQRRGGTPVIVLLTDGRANVGRDGHGGRQRAEQDALQAGATLKAAARRALLIDTAPRPSPQAQALALSMAARYLALPYADAAMLSRVVQAAGTGREQP